MKHAGTLRNFLALFTHIKRAHLHAFLAELLFILLAAAGGVVVGKTQLSLAAKMQSFNLGSLAADSTTALAQAATTRSVMYQLIAVLAVFAVYLFFAWTFTRALIWKQLLKLPPHYSFVRCSMKLSAVNLVWLPLTLAPLFAVLFYVASIYNAPLFSLTSRLSGYTYILFLQLILLALLMLYCHFTNLFYIRFFRAPKFRAVWDAVKQGVVEFPRFAKPLGILLVFFVVVMLIGSLTSFLPEPFKTIGAFAFLFVFSTVSRMWYITYIALTRSSL